MNENDLVKILDNYMGNEEYYMKPKIGEDETDFFIAKGGASAGILQDSIESAKDSVGVMKEKEVYLFTATPHVECAVCADVPNMLEIVPEEYNGCPFEGKRNHG